MTASGQTGQLSTVGADRRMIKRSRNAGVALVVVLLGVSAFALWSSRATNEAANAAVRANALSDDYGRAASAVAGEESLERKYRLEPGPDVRARFDATADTLVAALGEVRRDGSADDRVLVDGVLVQHAAYLAAVDALFAATDRGDVALGLQLDGAADPLFAAIESAVAGAASAQHDVALDRLARLLHLDRLTQRLTPLVFLVGLLLAAVLALVGRGQRRLLDAARNRAVHESLHDGLTGLPNRLLLADRSGQALRANVRSGTLSALLLVDLDRFKEINDTFGHHHGDELLKQVGSRLTSALRAVDTVARLGGDEFAVLVTDIGDQRDALTVAAKVRAVFEAPFHVEGIDLDIEASVGVAVSEDGGDAASMLQHADIAMYVAKTRNSGTFAYDPALDGHSPAKLALLGELRRAIERDELAVYYQPQVSLSTGDLVGVEALVRWHHPTRGMVLPDEFIPLAEHTGLITPLTRRVLEVAIRQARIWADDGHPVRISVNLSARNLLDERLPGVVAKLLDRYGVPSTLLELEVTESALFLDPVLARRLLQQLAGLGIRISIDDFGAGFTSLGQLKSLPLAELKIDRSFIVSMASDTSSEMIVDSIITLGHNLGLTIVAEGIETETTMTTLAGFGCDVAQGFLLSPAITAKAIETWRAERPDRGDRLGLRRAAISDGRADRAADGQGAHRSERRR